MIDHNGGGQFGGEPATGARRNADARVLDQSDGAMRSISYLVTGPLLYGAVGYGIDRWLGQWWGLPLGLIIGMGLGIYVIIRRFGGQE